jgi:hypothetical protein
MPSVDAGVRSPFSSCLAHCHNISHQYLSTEIFRTPAQSLTNVLIMDRNCRRLSTPSPSTGKVDPHPRGVTWIMGPLIIGPVSTFAGTLCFFWADNKRCAEGCPVGRSEPKEVLGSHFFDVSDLVSSYLIPPPTIRPLPIVDKQLSRMILNMLETPGFRPMFSPT